LHRTGRGRSTKKEILARGPLNISRTYLKVLNILLGFGESEIALSLRWVILVLSIYMWVIKPFSQKDVSDYRCVHGWQENRKLDHPFMNVPNSGSS
jgi:hypothetical protein